MFGQAQAWGNVWNIATVIQDNSNGERENILFEDTGLSAKLDVRYKRKRSVKDDVKDLGLKWPGPVYCLLNLGRRGEII